MSLPMSEGPVTVRIELTEDVLCCGGTATGAVVVTSAEPCPAREVVVALGCAGTARASGQTRSFRTDAVAETLFSGDLPAGVQRYPFSLAVPDVCSYGGTILEVSWSIRAAIGPAGTVAVRDGLAAEARLEEADERPVAIGPAAVTAADRDRRDRSAVVRAERPADAGRLVVPVLAVAGAGTAMIWFGWERDLALPGLAVAAAGAAGVALVARQLLLARSVAGTETAVEPTVVWPGERVRCRLLVRPGRRVEVEAASVTLEGWEHVARSTGVHRTTGPVLRHVFHSRAVDLEVPAALQAGVPVQIAGEAEVPTDAPCSMEVDDGVGVRWRLEIRLRLSGSPDWSDVQPVTVLPRKGAG